MQTLINIIYNSKRNENKGWIQILVEALKPSKPNKYKK